MTLISTSTTRALKKQILVYLRYKLPILTQLLQPITCPILGLAGQE